jgi:hypothetical protein
MAEEISGAVILDIHWTSFRDLSTEQATINNVLKTEWLDYLGGIREVR